VSASPAATAAIQLVKISQSLPAVLAANPGLESGYMMAQYTAAALVSENKVLAHPASVDSIPTGGGIEDHVSMAPIAARYARHVTDHAAKVVALELLCGCRALELRRTGVASVHDDVLIKIRNCDLVDHPDVEIGSAPHGAQLACHTLEGEPPLRVIPGDFASDEVAEKAAAHDGRADRRQHAEGDQGDHDLDQRETRRAKSPRRAPNHGK